MEEQILTAPSVPSLNNGYDNVNSDLIVSTSMHIPDTEENEYIITGLLGKGTFGQVFSAIDVRNQTNVAIKISKSTRPYREQGMKEVHIHQIVCILSCYNSLIIFAYVNIYTNF